VHLPLLGVFLTGMADNVFGRFHSMATYDILEADGIIEGIFTFDELKRAAMAENSPIAPIFEKLGYETRIAFTTMATMGLILFLHLV